MDVVDGLKLVVRWWFVTIPILIVSVAATLVITAGIEPEYVAEGSLLVVGPAVTTSTDTGEETLVNPLLVGSSGLSTVAEIATLSINTPEVARILEEEGLSSDFAVGAGNRSPILFIEAYASGRAVATETALRVAELIALDLALRQDAAGAPDGQRVTTSVISLSAVGGADYGGRTRIRIVMAVMGVGLSVGAAFLMESIRRRRDRPGLTSGADDADGREPSQPDGLSVVATQKTKPGRTDERVRPASVLRPEGGEHAESSVGRQRQL